MFGFHNFILICWIVFWTYWLISSSNTKSNKDSHRSVFLGLRLGSFLIILLLIRSGLIKSVFWSKVFASHSATTSNTNLETVGTAILVCGLLFAVWARVHLGRNWGTPMSHKKDPELITSGPYHYVRHPIYTGIIFASIGTAIAVSPVWILIFVISGGYFVYCAFKEENYLEKQFGESYKKYKKTSKMLIPFVL
jgi:protein-S-isoprenylcysteine O-methyltransferase Ste14